MVHDKKMEEMIKALILFAKSYLGMAASLAIGYTDVDTLIQWSQTLQPVADFLFKVVSSCGIMWSMWTGWKGLKALKKSKDAEI